MTEELTPQQIIDQKTAENEALRQELEESKKMYEHLSSKEKALEALEELTGSRDDYFKKAVKRAEEDEQLKNLPNNQKYKFGLMLCLGEERLSLGLVPKQIPPAFARSAGGSAASVMKKPTDFATARENAKKYLNK